MKARTTAVPARTARTSSIFVLVMAAFMLLFGMNLFFNASGPADAAKELLKSAPRGTVTDARIHVGFIDGMMRAYPVELTFTDEDGQEHVMETNHFPKGTYPGVRGWTKDFSARDQIIGHQVAYRLGDDPVVELVSELPALTVERRGLPHYLGLGFAVMGGGIAIGGVVSLVRAIRRVKAER